MSRFVLSALTAAVAFAAAGSLTAAENPRPLESFRSGETVLEPSADAARVYTLLVSPFAQPNEQFDLVGRTIGRLEKILGKGTLRVRISTGEPEDFETADMVICSAGTYLRMRGNNARALATVVSKKLPDPNRAEGSVFVTLKSRTDINTLSDLAGKRAAVTGPRAFSFAVAQSELAEKGYDPDRFFAETVSSRYDMPFTLELLRHGSADAAIVRTCFLEESASLGLDVSDIKPLGLKKGDFACMTSTDLYPNWTFLATARLESNYAREVAKALLTMSADEKGLEWSIASDFSAADAMYRSIRHGPYEYMRTWSFAHFWDEYRSWITAGVVVVLFILLRTAFIRRLLDKRTRELREAIDLQHDMEKRTMAAQSRMESLQRAGAVGQMSSIVAHELRQPLSTIVSYAHGVERMLDDGRTPDRALFEEAVGTIREQAEAAEKNIRKVCSYAKGKGRKHENCSLAEIVRRSAATVKTARMTDARIEVRCAQADTPYIVRGDAMELELAVQNLLKNALHAVSDVENPAVTVSLRRFEDEHGIAKIEVAVADNGKRLDDEAFARMIELLSSDKVDGLGLGIAIVSLIAENHGGRLSFERGENEGLTARIMLPEPAAESQNTGSAQG